MPDISTNDSVLHGDFVDCGDGRAFSIRLSVSLAGTAPYNALTCSEMIYLCEACISAGYLLCLINSSLRRSLSGRLYLIINVKR